ncbi:MAG: uracil-DNA glycosylase [bacterium]
MSAGRLDPRLVARLLRQRQELGVHTWPLETLDRREALALVEHARRAERAEAERAEAERAETESEVVRSGTGPAEAVAPAADDREGTDTLDPPRDYDALRQAALTCTRCRLAEGRTQVVFSDGHPRARVMVVGEAPGANEDRTGLPFVGAAGKLLDLLLASVGLSREDSVYICNVLKCRPPGNRDPRSDEIESCSPWLLRQIELVKPEVILAVGTFSGQLLTGRDMALGRLRGQVYSYQGTPLVITYHPAALLRNPGWTRATWDDLQLLRQVLDGS